MINLSNRLKMINEELVETTYNQDSPASLLLLLMTGEPELVTSPGLETRIAAAIEDVKVKKIKIGYSTEALESRYKKYLENIKE
jgi:hypothetical protein